MKEKERLWIAVQTYLNKVRDKIPYGLLVSHGYDLDDRKEYQKLKKAFGKK